MCQAQQLQYLTNNMSSEEVARYLVEVGSVERKLQYSRQILQNIFHLGTSHPRTNISKQDFLTIISSLGVTFTEEEKELIFGYFQVDGKTYLNMDQFGSVLLPRSDTSLYKLTSKRKIESQKVGQLDYVVRFGMQRIIHQIIEAEAILESLCTFTFANTKGKSKRLGSDSFCEFMQRHGNYPSEGAAELIIAELNRNKGAQKRNKQISEYINAYTHCMKNGQEQPQLQARKPLRLERTYCQLNKENSSSRDNRQMNVGASKTGTKLDVTHQSLINPLLSHKAIPQSTVLIADPRLTANPLDALAEVDAKIKALMSTVKFDSVLLAGPQKTDLDLSISAIQGKKEEKSGVQKKGKITQNVQSQLVQRKESSSLKNTDETPLRRLYQKEGVTQEERNESRKRRVGFQSNRGLDKQREKLKGLNRQGQDEKRSSSSQVSQVMLQSKKRREDPNITPQLIESAIRAGEENRRRIDYLKELVK